MSCIGAVTFLLLESFGLATCGWLTSEQVGGHGDKSTIKPETGVHCDQQDGGIPCLLLVVLL